MVRRKRAINASLCFLEENNAGGLFLDDEAGGKGQMDCFSGRGWFYQLPSSGLWTSGVRKGWKAPARAWWVPRPLDNGQCSNQRRKRLLPTKPSLQRNTPFVKEPQCQESFCLHSALESPGASVFHEIAFHFSSSLPRAITSHGIVLVHQFLILLIFIFYLTNAQFMNKTSKICSSSFCGLCWC